MTDTSAPPDLGEPPRVDLGRYRARLKNIDPIRATGRVVQVIGLTIEAEGLRSRIGELCYIRGSRFQVPIAAEVVGFRNDRILLMALGEMVGIQPGSEVAATGHVFNISVGPELLGRVIDGLGRPLDG